MPNRVIREDILTSERVALLSWGAEVFYRRLMSKVDDFGRFDGRDAVLRTALYPIQTDKVTERDVAKWKTESSEAGLVTVYAIGGKDYVQIERFGAPRAKDSKYPPPPPLICAQMRADANRCAQTHANAPYSYSYSGSDTNPLLLPQTAHSPAENPEGIRIREPEDEDLKTPASLDAWLALQPPRWRTDDSRVKCHAAWLLAQARASPVGWLRSVIQRADRGEWWKFKQADLDAGSTQIKGLSANGQSLPLVREIGAMLRVEGSGDDLE